MYIVGKRLVGKVPEVNKSGAIPVVWKLRGYLG